MGKKSRKREKGKVKKEKAKSFNLMVQEMKEASKLSGGSLISAKVAINPKIKERIESDGGWFILMFDDYNLRECELDHLDRTQANAVIEKFKHITSLSPRSIASSGIVRDNVYNNGRYRSLFTKLSPDVDLKETELPGGGRMFFHIVREYFCVVAIQAKHKSLD